MSVPRSVAEVLNEHVTLEVEGIDRRNSNKPEGVVASVKAQEKMTVFRTERAEERNHRRNVPVAGAFASYGQPALHLPRGPRLRPLLSEVQQLFSLHGQAVHQRSRGRRTSALRHWTTEC